MQSGQERAGEGSKYQRHFGVPVSEVVYGTDPSPYDRLTKTANDKLHPISSLDGYVNSTPVASSVWKTGWTTPACIVGFYLTALICAAAHLAVFKYLDGRVIDDNDEKLPFPTTSVSQNYATTASLALVTAFRASLVACIGLSYTQRLWQKMRNELLEVGLIEELFQIRANALRLLNPFTIRYAPLLVCVATLSWLLPVALIYPPGALVVGLDYRSVPEKFNVSIIPPQQDKLALQPTLEGHCTTGLAALLTIDSAMNCSAFSFSDSPRIGMFPMTTSILMARTSLASASIVDLSRSPHQNASYSMKFRGPKLRCTDSQRTRTMPFEDLSAYQSYRIGQYSWLNATGRPISQYSMMQNDSTLIIEDSTDEEAFGFVPCPPGALQAKDYNLTYSHLVQKSSMRTCVAATAEYSLNISFLNGQQRVDYSTGEVELLPRYGQDYGNQPTLAPARSFQEYFNLRALVDSLLLNLEQPGRVVRLFIPRTNATETRTVAWPNDSSVAEVCPLQPRSFVSTGSALPLLELSSFNRDRGKAVARGFNIANLDMSEKLLNEAIANITISALSLNTWYGLVDGSSTRVFNVYRFENWRSFYLPYGLSLLCAIPVLVLGLLALHRNGVAAIDGGFVQILMTTTGRTGLEKAAIGGCLGGQENVPQELKKLKVRFGELTESSSIERTGTDLGTDGDTMQSSRTGSKSALGKPFEERDRSKSNIMAEEIHEENRWESIPLEEQGEGKTTWTNAVNIEKPRGSQAVRRAGFGTLMETTPLERGLQYGTSQLGDRA